MPNSTEAVAFKPTMNAHRFVFSLLLGFAFSSCQVAKPKIELRPIKTKDAVFKKGAYPANAADKEIHASSILPWPAYPSELREARVQGFVLLAFVIDEKGKTDEVQIVSANDERFGIAAKKAAEDWTFPIPTLNGKPIRIWRTAPIKFVLTKESPSSF